MSPARTAMLREPKGQRSNQAARVRGAVAAALALAAGAAAAANTSAPPSLKLTRVPEPPELAQYVQDRKAAIALGKALFWDMQVGSDGVSCATCHYHAGADNRSRNQVSPGLKAGDTSFQVGGPNRQLAAADFPLHRLSDRRDRLSPVIRDANDVVSSQGVFPADFVSVLRGTGRELGKPVRDPVFGVAGSSVRRVEPRNAPTVINAVFNLNNFWDGRASNVFNGVNPFGEADAGARVFAHDGSLQPVRVAIHLASLASQAVGPPGSDFEMSYAGRSFLDIGRKMLSVRPLARQVVHPQDSVLGPLSRAARATGRPGLAATYGDLVKAAFLPRWWGCTSEVVRVVAGVPTVAPAPALPGPGDFTQMEANFALFFGLAVQLYEATLVSDDSPFDRFQEGDASAMTPSAQRGLQLFMTPSEPGFAGGSCFNCHASSEFTKATVSHAGSIQFMGDLPEVLVERMAGGDGQGAFYDSGYYNIGVRPTAEDKGRGGGDPFGWPLSFTKRALLADNGIALGFANPPLPCCPPGQSCPPAPCGLQKPAVDGAFKTPTLRNVELTGPYFHNGGMATLMQVVDFYSRGGDFHEQNLATLAPDVETLTGMTELAKQQLVDFLLSLTDERVRWEKAPFDHPELYLPNGSPGDATALACAAAKSCDTFLRVPAVGAAGRAASGLPPLGTFLGLDPHAP